MPLLYRFLTLIILINVTACNSTPATPTPVETAAAVPPVTATLAAPTVSVPTATFTTAPPAVSPTATARPASPTPVPSPAPQIYVVQEFDTLLGIALDYDTTTQAIAAANGMAEDDFLQLGQELVIPITSAAAAPAAAPTQTVPAGTPTPIGQQPAAQNSAASPTQVAAAAESAPPPAPTATPGKPLPAFEHGPNINPLTGLPVDDPATLRRRPLLVRIGNDVGARQAQIGFNSADMVYEDITEWWVTRFTAVFLANTPAVVGPVRSARLINVQLAPQFQGALAHSGGSDPVRWEISQAPLVNLDEFYNPKPYFYRPNEGWQTRLAIDTQAARHYLAAKKLDAPVSQPGFFFSDTVEGGESAPNIYVPYPRATSFTQWSYDAGSGSYLRYIAGAPLMDVDSGQVAANNVVIYFAEHQATDIVEDSNGATSIQIIVNGRGPAWFFRDGTLNKGYWETDGSRPPYFAYEDGRPYPLKPGNTWVEVVPTTYKIGLASPDEASSK